MIKAFYVTSLTFPKFYLRASNRPFAEVEGEWAQTSSSTESFRLPTAVSRLYNECFVQLPATSPHPGSPAISSSDFWDVLGQDSREDCHSNGAAAAEHHVPLSDAKQPF